MISAILISWLIGSAGALSPASELDVKAIAGMIGQAKVHEKIINARRDAELSASGGVPSPEFDRLFEELVQSDAALKTASDERERLMNKAVRLAVVAYGLASVDDAGNPQMPTVPTLHPQLREYGKSSATWSVSFRKPVPDKTVLAEGKRTLFGFRLADLFGEVDRDERKKFNGVTFPDGTSFIWPDLEDLTPAQLARLIHHEKAHFEIFTTKGLGDRLGESGREAEALRRDLANLGNFGFKEPELSRIAAHLRREQHIASMTAPNEFTVTKWNRLVERITKRIFGGHSSKGDMLDSSIPGFRLPIEEVEELRRGAERLAQNLDRREVEREMMAIASDSCESPSSLRYNDAFQARYRRLPQVSWTPEASSGDPCVQAVFGGLWAAKAQGLRNADWHAIADAATANGARGGGGYPENPTCSPGGVQPCPATSGSIPAVPRGSPVVRAELPPRAQPAAPVSRAWILDLLASRGCGDAWAFSQEELDGYWGRLVGIPGIPDGLPNLDVGDCRARLVRSLAEMAASGSPGRLTQEIFARTAGAAQTPFINSTVDHFPDMPGKQSPEIPTCRHHDWCREWRGNRP